MSGFTGNDGSELAGGLNPSGQVKALSVDASGNLNVNASVSSGPTNITQLNGHTISDASSDGAALTSTLLTALGAYNGATIDRLIHDLKRLSVSMYGKNAAAGDTPILLDAAGQMTVEQFIQYQIQLGHGFAVTTGQVATGASAAFVGLELLANAIAKNVLVYRCGVIGQGATTDIRLYQGFANTSDTNLTTNLAASVVNIGGVSGNVSALSSVIGSPAATTQTAGFVGSQRGNFGAAANVFLELLQNGSFLFIPKSVAGFLAAYQKVPTNGNTAGITAEWIEW